MLGEPLLVNLLNRLSRAPRSRPRDGLLLGFGRDLRGDRCDVRMPRAARCEHMMILGKTGTGKTHLLQQLADQHIMQAGDGFALFDFHGDSTNALLQMAAQHPQAAERLILIDPTDQDTSPGLNPLEVGHADRHHAFSRVAELTAILRARWNVEAFGPRSEELLRNVLYTLAVNALTLLEAPLLLTSTAVRRRLTAQLPSADIAAYWRDRFEPLSEPMKATFREPLLNKITGFLVEPSTRHLLGQSRSTIDFETAMQQGAWVLVNLSKGVLREHAHTLGNLIFAKLQFAVFGRISLPESRRRLFTVMVDEVQNLAENDLVSLLAEGRKFGVGLVTANQFWDQLPKTLRGALLAAGTQVFFRLSHADASVLAAELAAHSRQRYLELLTTLPRGAAVARVGAAAPVELTVPAAATFRSESRRQVTVLRSLALQRYAKSRAEIEQDIRLRNLGASESTLARDHRSEHAYDEGQHEW